VIRPAHGDGSKRARIYTLAGQRRANKHHVEPASDRYCENRPYEAWS